MTYFGRLAQRAGSAVPRAPAAPVGAPVAANGPDVAGLESVAEVTVSGTPEMIAQHESTSSPPREAVPAAVSEGRSHRHDNHAAPDVHDTAPASPPAPREWVASDSPLPPSAPLERLAPATRPAPDAVREISMETVAPTLPSDALRLRGQADPAPRTQSPEVPTATLSISTMTTEVEAPRIASRVPAEKSRAGEKPAALPTPLRARQHRLVETEDDIVVPSRTIVPAVARGRSDRDTAQQRQRDRAVPAAIRSAEAKSAVEVRIGAVTLQVHAPPAPAVPQSPVRTSFAPHRHYLRMW